MFLPALTPFSVMQASLNSLSLSFWSSLNVDCKKFTISFFFSNFHNSLDRKKK